MCGLSKWKYKIECGTSGTEQPPLCVNSSFRCIHIQLSSSGKGTFSYRVKWVGVKIQNQQYLMIICHKPNANAIVVTFCRHAKSPQLRRSL